MVIGIDTIIEFSKKLNSIERERQKKMRTSVICNLDHPANTTTAPGKGP